LYGDLLEVVRSGARRFPAQLGIKVSISESSLEEGELMFRGRKWVPDYESLRTKLIQDTYDSIMRGHPGHEATSAIMMQQFFWPNMLQDIRRFVQNCDVCC
jgi:hypothetical protein